MARTIANDLSVGAFARRAGVPVSTIHFYESQGLISGWRTPANHRRYDRRELRRVALIRVAQSVGLSLTEIGAALATLPSGTIKTRDWEKVSAAWSDRLARQIADLERLRDQLGDCIGCGCLSMEKCPLYNPDDIKGRDGHGPRNWMTTPS